MSRRALAAALLFSATCHAEWIFREDHSWPAGRDLHAMACDPTSGRALLFGGEGERGDTWTWSGWTWTPHRGAQNPPPRMGHAMAGDTARDRLVLFGGTRNFSGTMDDTWEWDGTGWTPMNPANSPPARFVHGLAYDESRSRTVLFGGTGVGWSTLADTWEWNGSNWTQRFPAHSPPAGSARAMVYDSVRSRVVLLSVWDGSGGTWEWDGTDWTQRFPVHSPPASGQMAFDEDRGRTVLFTPALETWEWDGTDWTKRSPAHSPGVDYWPAMTYDRQRQRVVLFGGVDYRVNVGSANETWEWDGVDWGIRRRPMWSPRANNSYATAFDRTRGRTLLFGGWDDGVWRDASPRETWEWDGALWSRRTTSASPPAGSAVMAFDSVRGRAVLLAWDNASPTSETWEWDGVDWTRRFPSRSPPPRDAAGMVYDSRRSRVVLFGGVWYWPWTNLADTWEWDGTDWNQVTSPLSPPARSYHSMSYDSRRGCVVAFGGLVD